MINTIYLAIFFTASFLILGVYFNNMKLKILALLNCIFGVIYVLIDHKFDLTSITETSTFRMSQMSSPTSSSLK